MQFWRTLYGESNVFDLCASQGSSAAFIKVALHMGHGVLQLAAACVPPHRCSAPLTQQYILMIC